MPDQQRAVIELAPALLALAAVVLPRAWGVTRHLVTIAHEGAHAGVARLTGRRLAGIRLHRDGSGLTVSKGRPAGFGMVVTAAAGYVGPSLVGLGGAALLARGQAAAALWLVVVLLALMLLQIRNVYGLLAVLVAGAVTFAVSRWAAPGLQDAVVHGVAWFLLLATPRTVVELQSLRRRGRAPGSDADVLARLTGVPGLVWVGVFLVVDLGALVLGARWLLVR